VAVQFDLSISEPENPADGKCWFKPDIVQAYMYLNGAWRPYVGGTNTITFDVGLNVFIRGVKRNCSATYGILNESFEKQDNLTYEIDVCNFTLWDNDGNARPTQGDEVQVFYKSSASATPDKIFGGEITEMPQIEQSGGSSTYSYEIQCNDYSIRLKQKLVTQDYTNQTAKAIIQDLVDNYATEFSYNNVETGLTVSFISFNYKPVDDCIREIAEVTGYDWYVDEDRDIHFFASTTNTAPYTITDNPATSGNYNDLVINVDKSQYRNRIIVQGGFFFSDDYTQDNVADGDQTSFQADYEPFVADSGNIEVYVDAGGGFVQKTLGIDNLDTSGFDFVVNQTEKVFKNLDLATLTAGHIFRAIYQYKVPILTQDDDTTSQENIRIIEGGDGIYEFKITDKTIETIQAAHDRAAVEIDQYANPIVEGSFRTKDVGYRSGQLLTINANSRGDIADGQQYLIQSVTTIVRGGTELEYDVVFATRLKTLTQFLMQLFDGNLSKEIVIRSDENLAILISPDTETMTITDSADDADIGLPFEWGAGGDRQGKWAASTTDIGSTTGIWG
jgi:hypothetical protein